MRGAIDSVLAQTILPHEVIVVDDGSTDDSAEIAQSYPRVRYLYQKNQGLAGARNTGILAATSTHVALLDSDDKWLPNYLEQMTELIVQTPNAAVYYCAAHCVDPTGQPLSQIIGGERDHTDLLNQMLRVNHIIPSTVILERDQIITAGLFDVAFRRLQDRELWVRLLKQGVQFAGLRSALVHYRVHDESLSADGGGGCAAVFALTRKHYGEDDSHYEQWSSDKRRAYAGAYSSCALTMLQRQHSWKSCFANLDKAITIDPTLAEDIDIFYELALGAQSLGKRGRRDQLQLSANAQKISYWMWQNRASHPTKLLKTAYVALATVAYNTQQFGLCRQFIGQLFRHATREALTPSVIALAIKASLGTRTRTITKAMWQFANRRRRPTLVEAPK